MARIRSIKPDVCTSFTMALLSDAAERFFVRLWTHADDDGRGIDSAKLIKAAVFPLNDDKTEEVVEGLMVELEAAGFMWRYEVDGRRYFQVPNFGEHQKPRHPVPSKYPSVPSHWNPATAIGGSSAADRRSPTAVVVGVVVDGEVVGAPPQKRRGAPTEFPVTDDLRAWAAEQGINVDLVRETGRFLDHHRARAAKFSDWRAAWRSWMAKAQELSGARPGPLQVVRGPSLCAKCEGMGVVELEDGLAADCECKTKKAS